MPKPRNVSTANRAAVLKKVGTILSKQKKKLAKVVKHLSVEHVDDKKKATMLRQQAQKMLKALDKVG